MAEGILKGLSVCTGCAAAPQWPVDLSPPSEGISLAKLKMEGLRSGSRVPRSAGENRPGCPHGWPDGVKIGRGTEPRTAKTPARTSADRRAGGEETAGICVLCGVGGVRAVASAAPLEAHGSVMRVLRVLHV